MTNHQSLFTGNLFKFCPHCGKESFKPKSEKESQCSACGFRFFFNAAGAVAAIIMDQHKRILLSKRAHDPAAGTFDLPGGFIDNHETAEEALQREIHEELNLKITGMTFLFSVPNHYKFANVLYHTIDLFFLCTVESFKDLRLKDGEVEDYCFMNPLEIDIDILGLKSIKQGMTILQQKLKDGEIRL